MRVVSRLMRLMAEKQIRDNRMINAVIVSKETGLRHATVMSWIRSDLRRFDEEVIVAFCKYFECDIGDLLVLEQDEKSDIISNS